MRDGGLPRRAVRSRGPNLRAGTDGYATHLPFLAWALASSADRDWWVNESLSLSQRCVVEMGGGYYSTPTMLSLSGERAVITIENDAAWMESLAGGIGDTGGWWHRATPESDDPQAWLRCMDRAAREACGDDAVVDVLLIDHAPMGCRPGVLRELLNRPKANRPRIIICHDTHRRARYKNPLMQEWCELGAQFGYATRYEMLDPPTTVISDFVNTDGIVPGGVGVRAFLEGGAA